MGQKVLVSFEAAADKHDVVIYILENITNRMRLAPGNTKAKIYQNVENKDLFLLEEDWSSQETHQDFLAELEENGLLDQLKSVLKADMSTEVIEIS